MTARMLYNKKDKILNITVNKFVSGDVEHVRVIQIN